MTIFVRTRATVGGEECDLLVEVRKMDAKVTDDDRTVVLLDDISVFASPGVPLTPVSLGADDDVDLLAAVERAIEESQIEPKENVGVQEAAEQGEIVVVAARQGLKGGTMVCGDVGCWHGGRLSGKGVQVTVLSLRALRLKGAGHDLLPTGDGTAESVRFRQHKISLLGRFGSLTQGILWYVSVL